MGEANSDPLENQARPKSRRWFRYLFASLFLFFLLLAGLSTWIYQDQTYFINQALSRFPDLNLEVEKARVNLKGEFEVEDLKWNSPERDGLSVEIPSLKGQVDWNSVTQGHFQKLEIENPKVIISPTFFDSKNKESIPPLAPLVSEVVEAANPSVETQQVKVFRLDDFHLKGGEVYFGKDKVVFDAYLKGVESESNKIRALEEIVVKGEVFLAESPEVTGVDGTFELVGNLKKRLLTLDKVQVEGVELERAFSLSSLRSAEAPKMTVQSEEALPKTGNLGVDEVQIRELGISETQWNVVEQDSDLRFQGKIDLRLHEVHWFKDGKYGAKEWEVQILRASLKSLEGESFVEIPQLSLSGNVTRPNRVEITQLESKDLDLHWNPSLQAKLAKFSSGNAETSSASPIELTVKTAKLEHTKLDLKFGEDMRQFQVKTQASLQLKEVEWKDQTLTSSALQRLEVRNAWLGYPKLIDGTNETAFLSFPHGTLELNYEKFQESKHVETLLLDHPVLRVSWEVTPWWLPEPSSPNVTPATSNHGFPFWKKLNFNHLQVDGGKLEVAVDPKYPKLVADWEIETSSSIEGESLHLVSFHQALAHLPEERKSPFPVLQIPTAKVGVKLPDLWTKRHLESIYLDHASVEASEALLKSFQSDKTGGPVVEVVNPTQDMPLAPTPLVIKPWTVGKVDIQESFISVNSLIPGVPTLRFGVQFSTENAPLEWKALQSHLEPQEVRLSQINIPSPYEPLRNVAQLNEVVLTFSLEGLANQTIDKVEINNPRLYVGEDLFWYVDYYRNYKPVLVETTLPVGWSVLKDTLPIATVWKEPFEEAIVHQSIRKLNEDWQVKRLEVHEGELILAPKGKPVKGFKKPFPFSLSTELMYGTLEAELDIPTDTYTLEDFKLELQGMRGKVQFNLPLKSRDNNLVETFQVDAIRWKDLKTGEAFLTLTYDAMGIYAKFGAEAYDGYVNGEVNVYLDDSYHWDGWVSAKTVNTKPITQKLSPGSFLLEGKVDATVLGQGSKSEIYQADVDFVNATPGIMSIQALNDLMKELPGETGDLENQLSRIGVETLRDFEYDTATGKARIYGREAKANISFKGPHGSRNFEINVYDHRWKVDQPLNE